MAKRGPSGDGMVRKRENGRWEGRIVVRQKRGGEPIYHSVYAKMQKELLDKLHREIERYGGVELTKDSLMTLSVWLERWLDKYAANAENTAKHSTLKNCHYTANHVKRELGGKQVSSITAEDLQQMYHRLIGRGLPATTMRRVHAAVGYVHESDPRRRELV